MKKVVLLIDDDPMVADAISACLEMRYDVRLATTGRDGLVTAQLLPQPDIILLDVELPDLGGFEVCEALKRDMLTASIPVIFLTGHTDVVDVTHGFDLGAADYVTKPVMMPVLLARLQTHLRLKEMYDQLKDQNTSLESLVQRRTHELLRNQELTIVALGSLAETRDNETGNHIHRTRAYVEILARRLASKPTYRDVLEKSQWEAIWRAAPLHDIGKVGIPDHILLKPGKLTEKEFSVMKQHTVLGCNALRSAERQVHSDSQLFMVAADIALSHHERWDGLGYPEGLSEHAIPLAARLMAVADVYDALVSDRVYKAAMSHQDAVDIIRAGQGSQFDPQVVDCFICEAERFSHVAAQFCDDADVVTSFATTTDKANHSVTFGGFLPSMGRVPGTVPA